MSKDYQKLYNDLKTEYEQSLQDNDEICKEYESTIQMLTDSVNNFQKEKDAFQSRINQLENEIKKYEKEKETLANRNKDKILDIQNLNKLNDKLQEDMKKILNEKNLTKSKIIALENDNDHFQNILRQNEALIEDLNNQLESALEENITLQTEFELYKQKNEETLVRKEQEIKDFLNDISNKEKIIQRLNDKRASIRELKEKFLMPKDLLDQFQRKLTTSTPFDDIKSFIINKNNSNKVSKCTTLDENKIVTPLSNSKTKYPEKFMEIYRKSIRRGNNPSNKVIEKNETIKKSTEIMNDVNINDSLLVKNSSKGGIEKDNLLMSVDTLNDNTIIYGNLEDNEKEQDNKEEVEEDDSIGSDKKIFEDLVICDEKDFTLAPIKKLMKENENRTKKLTENLKALLAIIQMRKEALINHHKINYKIFEKNGFKMKRKKLLS